MKKSIIALALTCLLLVPVGAVRAATFLPNVTLTTGWHDADKTSLTAVEDSLMCWAAVASNMITYGKWNMGTGYATTDDVFGNYQDHWLNTGGFVGDGLEWWFTGQMYPPYVTSGGGHWDSTLFNASYSMVDSGGSLAMSGAITSYIDGGSATGISIYDGGQYGHAITVWGYEFGGNGTGTIWITDSDDQKNLPNPTDSLLAVALLETAGAWYLQDYYGTDDYYIRRVYGLDVNPTPVPGAVWLFGSGLLGLVGLRRLYIQ